MARPGEETAAFAVASGAVQGGEEEVEAACVAKSGIRERWGAVVASHPCARKKAQGWGTASQRGSGRRGWNRGIPPMNQKVIHGWGTRSCVNTQLENAVVVSLTAH